MTDEHAPLDRRRCWRSPAERVGAGLLPHSVAAAATGPSAALRPVSMAMHIHGSFSEGTASMHAHLQQARRLGVDVIWWTDHDFRQYALGYRQAVRFDARTERENGHPLSWEQLPATGGMTGAHAVRRRRAQPGRARRFAAPAGGRRGRRRLGHVPAGGERLELHLQHQLRRHRAHPRRASGPVRAGRRRSSSRSARATARRPRADRRVSTGSSTAWAASRAAGPRRTACSAWSASPVEQPGTWQRLRMDLQADHDALWPDTVRGDASLKRLRVGVRGRQGAGPPVTSTGCASCAAAARRPTVTRLLTAVAREYRGRYSDVTTYPSAEISLVNHLNAFGGDGTLPTYPDDSLVKDGSDASQRAMVQFLHRHGAVVALNHPATGPPGSDKLARKLVTTRGNGCDLVEVGRDNIEERPAGLRRDRSQRDLPHRDRRDRRPRRSRLAGRPSSPAGSRRSGRHRSPESDLCAALVAGRAWFFDPLYWRGRLDLTLAGQAPMGGVIFTGKDRPALTVRVTGAADGQPARGRHRPVRPSGPQRPDAGHANGRGPGEAGAAADSGPRRCPAPTGVYARVVVRLGDGTIVGCVQPGVGVPAAAARHDRRPPPASGRLSRTSGRAHASQRKNRPAMRVTTAANPSSTAIGASTADGPSPRTITSSIPSFRYVSGSTLETVRSHSGRLVQREERPGQERHRQHHDVGDRHGCLDRARHRAGEQAQRQEGQRAGREQRDRHPPVAGQLQPEQRHPHCRRRSPPGRGRPRGRRRSARSPPASSTPAPAAAGAADRWCATAPARSRRRRWRRWRWPIRAGRG